MRFHHEKPFRYLLEIVCSTSEQSDPFLPFTAERVIKRKIFLEYAIEIKKEEQVPLFPQKNISVFNDPNPF